VRLVKVSNNLQTDLPVELGRRLRLRPGDVLLVIKEKDAVVIDKLSFSHVDALEQCASGQWANANMEVQKSRTEWDT